MRPQVVVLGTLNTDISVTGIPALPGPDEDAFGSRLAIGAGGKARNVAEMMARLLGPGAVAFVGRTVRDRFGLWRVPYDALRTAGVDMRFVRVGAADEASGAPAIALVAVDLEGRHSSSVNIEPASSLSEADIDLVRAAFQRVARGAPGYGGLAAMSLEMPGPVAAQVARAAVACSLTVVLDPGGWPDSAASVPGFAGDLFLIKPNAIEAERLTGVRIDGFGAAGAAARVLMGLGTRNVLITHGANGAYLFGEGLREHIRAPGADVGSVRDTGAVDTGPVDSTGCGDQVMATVCALLCRGWDLSAAARLAVSAGTMQYHRAGVRPLTRDELDLAAADYGGADYGGAGRGSVDGFERLGGDQR